MTEINDQILDKDLDGDVPPRRRKLLPWWIKIFCWFFMLTGAIAPFGILFAIMHWPFHLSMYGLSSTNPFSLPGAIVLFVFILKGVTSFSLWMEKDWAIKLSLADAVVGLILSVAMTFVPSFLETSSTIKFNFRFEIVLLILFLMKMLRIQKKWEETKLS